MQSRAHRVKLSGGRFANRAKGSGVDPPSTPKTPPPRTAALDLGAARVGLAVADELGWLAHPRPFLDGKNRRVLLDRLRELAAKERIEHFLVGLPRTLDGKEGAGARRARQFADELARATGCSVELIDERLSTVEAQARLREQGLDSRGSRTRIDSASAAVLLQSWLDARRAEAREP